MGSPLISVAVHCKEDKFSILGVRLHTHTHTHTHTRYFKEKCQSLFTQIPGDLQAIHTSLAQGDSFASPPVHSWGEKHSERTHQLPLWVAPSSLLEQPEVPSSSPLAGSLKRNKQTKKKPTCFDSYLALSSSNARSSNGVDFTRTSKFSSLSLCISKAVAFVLLAQVCVLLIQTYCTI